MKILVFTATYNEAGNIERLVKEVFENLPQCSMLVIDDNSPDGTGKLLDELKNSYPKLDAIHREGKLGLGNAHKMAMQYALKEDYDYLITMDADFSHDPKYLKDFEKLAPQYDFVIGSRYADGGHCDYGFVRTLISVTANMLTRLLLGIKLKETTTSYRCYSKNLLSKFDTTEITSEGYSFFIEAILRVSYLTKSLTEFPIVFMDRAAGETKISKAEIYKGVLTLFQLFLLRISGKAKPKSIQPPA